MRRASALLALALLATACGAAEDASPPPRELLVGVASSLEPLFQELATAFEAQTGARVTLVTGASGSLARQIEQGAPLDLFASADRRFTVQLMGRGLVQNNRGRAFAEGTLVMVTARSAAPGPSWQAVVSGPDVERVAIANPELAPYGERARTALRNEVLWDAVEPSVVFGGNVAQVLQFVRSGNADAGFVALSQVRAGLAEGLGVYRVDPCLHGRLEQTIVGVATTRDWELAEAFFNYVGSPPTEPLIGRFGYVGTLGRFEERECG